MKKKEWMLALRAVTSKPLSYFLDNKRVIETKAVGDTAPDYGVRMAEGELYNTGDLRSTCHLVTHHDTWDWSALAYKAYITLLFIRCLQKADYFGENQSNDMSIGPTELLVGGFMSHVMEVASMNSHEVGVVECPASAPWITGQTRPVGVALEPSLVLLNHSCDPSMIRVNVGAATVAFAARNIARGEEITDCYSHPFDVTPMAERQQYLDEKYKFTCQCKACKEKWKTAQDLPKSFNDISMEQLKLSGSNMATVQAKMKNVMMIGAKINQLQKVEDFASAVDLYQKFDSGLNEILRKPHQFHLMIRRSLATCLWLLHGNKHRLKE